MRRSADGRSPENSGLHIDIRMRSTWRCIGSIELSE